MPEGDTVWLAAKRLHATLAGHVLTSSDLRVPSLATVDLAGREVHEVVSRGKHLLARIAGELTLHSHLRMDGSWHLYRPGAARRGGPEWQVRAVLANADWEAVGYRLPVLELLPTGEESRIVGHLGPDLLGADWDADEATRRLLGTPQRETAPALLDQRNLAGIGNLYAAEVCFLAGISPWSPISAVEDLPGLLRRAQTLLERNREVPEQSTTGDLRKGQQHWVYGRRGRPCRRCGTAIEAAEQGAAPYARLTFWCPRCQPGPQPGIRRPAHRP